LLEGCTDISNWLHTHSAHNSSACASAVFTASSCKSGG
jgi:hypothetical protein